MDFHHENVSDTVDEGRYHQEDQLDQYPNLFVIYRRHHQDAGNLIVNAQNHHEILRHQKVMTFHYPVIAID